MDFPEMGHAAGHFFSALAAHAEGQPFFSALAAHAAGQLFFSALTAHAEGQPFFSALAAHAAGQLFFSALTAHAEGQPFFSAAAAHAEGHFAAHPPPSALAAPHSELFAQDAFFSSAPTPHIRPTTRRTTAPTETHFTMSDSLSLQIR